MSMEVLSEQFKAKALAELREDDFRKQQALEQFREWISKQGHIKNCRTDDSFLLRFLRVKKYSNADAFKMLEKFNVSCETHPQWFRGLTLDDNRMRELFDNGYIFPLKERDENGCRVVIIRASRLDTKKFTFSDEITILNLIIFTLLEEPETQISGFIFIIDLKDIAFDYVTNISLIDVRNYLKCIQNTIPCRQKKGIWLNLPGFAVALTDFGKSLVSAKLRERAYFHKDSESIFQHVDKKILPKEYGGGETTIQEMMDNFEKILNSKKEKLLETDRQSITLKTVEDQPIGSFRKLEID